MEQVKKKRGRPRKTIENAAQEKSMIVNGLSEAIMGFTPGGIGTQLDQVDTTFVNNRWYLVSNMRQLLSELYAEHGLIQTVVNVPVDDGLRNGVEIRSRQLSDEELAQLVNTIERNDDINTVGQALKWNRLFGGAGVVVITDQDPMTPINEGEITKDTPLEFRAVDMWELFWDKQNDESYDPTLQEHKFEYFSYYGTKLHKSRVFRMKGLQPPSFIRPRLRGWGLSVVESLIRSINQYFKTNGLCFEVLDEFKLDIFKIKNLTTTLLSSQGTAQIQQRVQLANQQKNYQNAITMDSEDDYVQKQLSFSGIAEILEQIRIQIASDLRMPITKIFGISASGFNSGEDDIENYNAMIESEIRSKCKYDILKVVELRCQQLFGFVPDDLSIHFKPLRTLSGEQEENVKTQKFNRLIAARQSGEIDATEFRKCLNKDDLLPLKLEDQGVEMIETDEDMAEDGSDEIPGQQKAYSRAATLESEKRYGRMMNYFTEADHIKIPFEKDKHPRDKDGVFATHGKTSKEVKERQQYERRKEKLEKHGKLWVVVWRVTDKGEKAIVIKEMLPSARDRVKAHFGSGYVVESHSEKPSFEEGHIRKHENDIMPEEAQTVLEDLTAVSIQNPGGVDEAVWEKAKEACIKEYGKIKYPVVMAIYKKMKGEK
jgi:phage-related protein (TIGR01555 family)